MIYSDQESELENLYLWVEAVEQSMAQVVIIVIHELDMKSDPFPSLADQELHDFIPHVHVHSERVQDI